MAGSHPAHHAGRAVDRAVVHEQQLGHPEAPAARALLGPGQGSDLVGQGFERALALVDRHHHRDLVEGLGLPGILLAHAPGILARIALE